MVTFPGEGEFAFLEHQINFSDVPVAGSAKKILRQWEVTNGSE